MTDRILFSANGLYVSRPGIDVKTATQAQLSLSPNMNTMFPVISGVVTLGSGARSTIPISNPTGKIPYVIVADTNGQVAARNAFFAESFSPYNAVDIVNVSGSPTRNIRYVIMISNT